MLDIAPYMNLVICNLHKVPMIGNELLNTDFLVSQTLTFENELKIAAYAASLNLIKSLMELQAT